MSYQEEWKAIAASIAGIERAEEILSANKNPESFGATDFVQGGCARVAENVEIFAKVHKATLPVAANEALSRCLLSRAIQNVRGHPVDRNSRSAAEAIAVLSVFASEMAYALADRHELLRSRSARAFLNLQQRLVASSAVRAEWREAFDDRRGEVACERLGGAHLLLHGIYGFKAGTAGSETDLCFGEPLDVDEAARTSDGLVLTEWKLAKTEAEVAAKFNEAFAQIQHYPETVLGGLVLRGYRYLVVVTEARIARAALLAARREVGGIIYVPVNIAIAPQDVSVQAKADVRAGRKAAAKT